MPKSVSQPPRARSPWLIPAMIALVAFIGGVASNLVATDLETILPSYRFIVWGVFAIAMIIAIAAAIWEARKTPGQPTSETSATSAQNRSVAVGGDVKGSTIITGDRNITGAEERQE